MYYICVYSSNIGFIYNPIRFSSYLDSEIDQGQAKALWFLQKNARDYVTGSAGTGYQFMFVVDIYVLDVVSHEFFIHILTHFTSLNFMGTFH